MHTFSSTIQHYTITSHTALRLRIGGSNEFLIFGARGNASSRYHCDFQSDPNGDLTRDMVTPTDDRFEIMAFDPCSTRNPQLK